MSLLLGRLIREASSLSGNCPAALSSVRPAAAEVAEVAAKWPESAADGSSAIDGIRTFRGMTTATWNINPTSIPSIFLSAWREPPIQQQKAVSVG